MVDVTALNLIDAIERSRIVTRRKMEMAATGVRPYLVNWFNDVFIPAFKDLDGKPNELKDEFGNIIIKEKYVPKF